MPDLSVLDRLRANLLTSGLQQRNSALFQVIDQLIQFVRSNFQTTNATVTTISGGGGSVVSPPIFIGNGSGLFPVEIGEINPSPCTMPVADSKYDGTTLGNFTQMM